MRDSEKASIADDASRLKAMMKFIGDSPLDSIHQGALQPFIASKRQEGIKSRTINHYLQVVRHILNLAAQEWVDENGLTWLATAPRIKFIAGCDHRKPTPLSWEEQERLFRQLPIHLCRMGLFKVNTGCRDTEVTRLQWQWEQRVSELDTSVFVIPAAFVKNRRDRLVVLNDTARSVIEAVRGDHPMYVFTYKGAPIARMNNSAWQGPPEACGVANDPRA